MLRMGDGRPVYPIWAGSPEAPGTDKLEIILANPNDVTLSYNCVCCGAGHFETANGKCFAGYNDVKVTREVPSQDTFVFRGQTITAEASAGVYSPSFYPLAAPFIYYSYANYPGSLYYFNASTKENIISATLNLTGFKYYYLKPIGYYDTRDWAPKLTIRYKTWEQSWEFADVKEAASAGYIGIDLETGDKVQKPGGKIDKIRYI